ncbi:MAG TPA: 2-C-methyl-D-erythritol 4-phosphate cytidylyltransferase [Abditibacteriaceae bacterium]|jgi:2-C-methyl-D-erythritol 4-phosphate cytidylyltransferase
MQTISILVPAAGCGSRAETSGNKILAPLCGEPLLWHTLRALTNLPAFPAETQPLELILATRREEWELIQPILSKLNIQNSTFKIQLVVGGTTRQDSVFAAAQAARGDFLLVHDAARPLVSPLLIKRVIKAALQNGAALAALPCPDTVKQAKDGFVELTLDRSVLWLAQTPQVFRRALLLDALENAAHTGFEGTDCASLLEHLGHPVQLVPGEARNFKVTYPDDLERAETMLKAETLSD